MIILFGIRRLRKGMGTILLRCTNCGMSPLTLIRVSTWFSLFFIPVIPLHFKHYTSCSNCKRLQGVPKAVVEQAHAQQGAAAGSGDAHLADAVAAPVTLERAVNAWAAEPATAVHLPSADSTAVSAAPGSPPPQPAAGWYPDPGGSGDQRYWDGQRWTEHIARQT
jgi:hypothetical protein